MSFIQLLLTGGLVLTACFAAGPYSGHKVIRLTPESKDQVVLLKALLQNQNENLDVWREPLCVHCNVDIRLSREQYDDVTSVLSDNGFQPEVLIENVQTKIDWQMQPRGPEQPGLFDYSRYHRVEEIYRWIHNITEAYENITSVFNIGWSYEGRPLLGVKISTTPGTDKPAFYFEGGIHAREWISPATVLYMVGQMLDNYNKNANITAMVDMFDWYILPVTNPDGYAYTWQDDEARLWRKTRSPTNDSECIGVDPNRNWGKAWGEPGASDYPCSDLYHGHKQFSEPEVKLVAGFLSNIKNLKAFIDFHSYCQIWTTPWGFERTLPDDYKKQNEGAALAVEALTKVYGTEYRHGNFADSMYVASGTTIDWVYGELGVKYSYLVELRDTGSNGFLLPENQIVPTGIETLHGLMALAKYIHEN